MFGICRTAVFVAHRLRVPGWSARGYTVAAATAAAASKAGASANSMHQGIQDRMVSQIRVVNEKPGLSFGVTERAARRLSEIYKESQEILKVSVESGGCHGFQYNLKLVPNVKDSDILNHNQKTFETAKEEEDGEEEDAAFEEETDQVLYVLPKERGKVLIDENSLKILNNTYLAYTTELIGSTFKIAGGNMKSSCGCGSSFDIDT